MTGAEVLVGADCVIMVEHTQLNSSGNVLFSKNETKNNICYLGEDVKSGEKVLEQGIVITPSIIALAASVGKTRLLVFTPPQITLIATGDELVEPDITPEGPFIRNSNAFNLQAQIGQTPAQVIYAGIIDDNKEKLAASITYALKNSDIVILTGGVSIGDKDFVPEILRSFGHC